MKKVIKVEATGWRLYSEVPAHFANAWFMMLLWGMLAGDWGLPTISYWQSFIIIMIAHMLFRMPRVSGEYKVDIE